VVVKGLAFLGDAVAHSSLAGAAVAFVAGGGSFLINIGAVVAAVLTAIGVAALSGKDRLREDTAIALLFAALFAFGVLLISRARNYALELNSFIVGNILSVGTSDLVLMGALTALIVVLVTYFYPELLYASYDPEMASAAGIPVGVVRTGLLVLVALASVIAFRLVGVVLVMAMLVAPAAAATLIVRRIPVIMATGTVLGIISTVAGLYGSFYGDVAAGPAIVMASIAIFALVFVVAPRGLLASFR